MTLSFAWAERRATRYAPAWRDGEAEVIEIRHVSTGAILHRLTAPTLAEADLAGLDLQWANLRGANLQGASLQGADLRGACIHYADLRNATLRSAELEGASLAFADLAGADLAGATFRGRGTLSALDDGPLLHANLAGAYYDSATRWPARFSPEKQGCIPLPPTSGENKPIPAAGAAGHVDALPVPQSSPAPAFENLPAPAQAEHPDTR